MVHHALIDPFEPWFERRMLPESFACRKGKGTHRARDHARRMLRRHQWFPGSPFKNPPAFDRLRSGDAASVVVTMSFH